MNRRERQAVLLSLLQNLQAKGSWCGETHLQKATYFLQTMLGVPLDLNVIFYKFGPYSFDLADEVTALRADQLLDVKPKERYGPSLLPSVNADKVLDWYSSTVEEYLPHVRFVAERLGTKNVAELERLSTALWVMENSPDKAPAEQVAEIVRLKPHVPPEDAEAALAAVRGMRAELG